MPVKDKLVGESFGACISEEYIFHAYAVLEFYPVSFKIAYKRQDKRLVLVVFGKFERREIRQSAYMMDKSLEVQLHFQGGVPFLKGKHRLPVQPEV